MIAKRLLKAFGTIAGSAGLIITGTMIGSPSIHADDANSNSDEARIEIGFQIAPVPLNYDKQDRKLVGLGAISSTPPADATDVTAPGPRPNGRPDIIPTCVLPSLPRPRK